MKKRWNVKVHYRDGRYVVYENIAMQVEKAHVLELNLTRDDGREGWRHMISIPYSAMWCWTMIEQ